jgi:MFS family permease
MLPCSPNVAPSLGPVLGGALSQHVGWWWIFWLLAMLSALCLLLIVVLLPETSRLVVGNGSAEIGWHHKTALAIIQRNSANDDHSTGIEAVPKRKFRVPNPITCLRLLFHRSTALIVLVNGIFYMTYGCIQASMSSLFIQLYGFNELEAGLIYLPFGAGCALASFLSGIVHIFRLYRSLDRQSSLTIPGHIMNWDYRRIAKDYGLVIDKVAGDDMSQFPIEKARYRSIWLPVIISSVCTVGYGWSLHTRTVGKYFLS